MLKLFVLECSTVEELESAMSRMGLSKVKPELAVLVTPGGNIEEPPTTPAPKADTRLESVETETTQPPAPKADAKPPRKSKRKGGGGGFRKAAPKTYHDMAKLEGIGIYHKADGSQKVVGIIGRSEGKGGNAGHEILWLGNVEKKDGEIVCWSFQNGDPWTHNATRFPETITDLAPYSPDYAELLVEMVG